MLQELREARKRAALSLTASWTEPVATLPEAAAILEEPDPALAFGEEPSPQSMSTALSHQSADFSASCPPLDLSPVHAVQRSRSRSRRSTTSRGNRSPTEAKNQTLERTLTT